MRGLLTMKNIEVDCIIGVYDEERTRAQKVRLDVEVEVDFLESLNAHTPENTVDWSKLPKDLSSVLIEGKFHLAESACVALLQRVFAYSSARAAKVILTKLEAETGAESVSASLEAKREEVSSF